jgi:hypothetical protein
MKELGPFRNPKSHRTFRYSRKFHDYGHKIERQRKTKGRLIEKMAIFLQNHSDRVYTITDLQGCFPERQRKGIEKSLLRLFKMGKVIVYVTQDDKAYFAWRELKDGRNKGS